MSDQYLGEIRMVGFNFAPQGWAFCNGQIMSIQQNTALFSLLGTTYGGNGQTTFALPNLQSRVPIHWGQGPGLSNYDWGQTAGVEGVQLTTQQMPQHNHLMAVNGAGASASSATPAGNVLANTAARGIPGTSIYAAGSDGSTMLATAISFSGSSGAHTNIQPYLAVTFIIALVGIYPPRN
ncbi:MAG TPA: tail fiber protein [Acidobacteriaceae bacterium]|jgi:microcystin-dependent protein